MKSGYIPTSQAMTRCLRELELRIPRHELVERLHGLPVTGQWAAAIGSLNTRGAAPVMVVAMFVVIDLSEDRIRLANPMTQSTMTVETFYTFMSLAMTHGYHGEAMRPCQLICPQPEVARGLRPMMLKLETEIVRGEVRAFEAIFELLREDVVDG